MFCSPGTVPKAKHTHGTKEAHFRVWVVMLERFLEWQDEQHLVNENSQMNGAYVATGAKEGTTGAQTLKVPSSLRDVACTVMLTVASARDFVQGQGKHGTTRSK